ncbi:D-sedoheptulose 7-phosphate isomerase [uncultured Proteiniphilum sp.]|uniref:D-sedoheptulose 7-phosphate isomerase n=1 Tax=uncultured Proteiniphilum sp. TaxID=497637 RepID=UPI00261C1DA3|nr:D-sedoheptulose 7-phosphate isomerase [uncultured Proteiniphilum sp.]
MDKYIIEAIKNGIILRQELLKNKVMLRSIKEIGELACDTIRSGHKILLCGNGGSAADAQHIAAELVGRFVKERKGLPAIALTTDTSILTSIGNDYGFDEIFSRQVEALAAKGDLLIGISTSGNSENVYRALRKAKDMNIETIGFLGKTGGKCKDVSDIVLLIDSYESARIQEIHIMLGHIMCGIVDHLLDESHRELQ